MANSDDEEMVRQRADWDEAEGVQTDSVGVQNLYSITQRCRKRLEWANSEDLDVEASTWVCPNKDCKELFCNIHHDVKAAKESLENSRPELENAKQALEEARNHISVILHSCLQVS